MALARYRDNFWFPNGILASNVEARVFPLTSSAFAPLWTDATGTVPIANPTSTNGAGVLEFWAETGEYWIHLDTETFHVFVGKSQEQADLSTGLASGGHITVNAGNPQAVDITAIDGYVLNFTADNQDVPVITRVKTTDQTVALDAASLARSVTWWMVDAAGNIIQQGTNPTNIERRTRILLGVTTFFGGSIVLTLNNPVLLQQQANQLADLMVSLGPFVIEGNVITPNGANRMINQSAGRLFSRSFNHYDSAGNVTQDPHVATTFAQTPAQFRYITSTGTVFGPLINTIDVANFDSGGVITPIGGGANTSSIHRVWLFATDIASAQLAIQYGQNTYSSLSAAVNALGSGLHDVNPLILGNGALIAQIAATRTATNLSDPAQAMIITPGKFATP